VAITISVDAMGGDYGPEVAIKAASNFFFFKE